MNIGIDFHDTFIYNPDFFINIINTYPSKKFIVTGTPENDEDQIIKLFINSSSDIYKFIENYQNPMYEYMFNMNKSINIITNI